MCQKRDFRKKFPPFQGFSIKRLLVTRGFDTRGFPFPPMIRELQGPPVSDLPLYSHMDINF